MYWKQLIPIHGNILQRTLQLAVRNISVAKTLSKDHYEALGLKKDATQAEIKNAYFELSKIYHPDRIEATDENLAKFREISNAYEVLSNEQSRKLYDRGLIEDDICGIDDPHDPKDPIIKFYQQKQQGGRGFGQAEELDEWTQKFYESSRAKTFAKNDLFPKKGYARENASQGLAVYNFIFTVSLITGIVLSSNDSETAIGKFFGKYLG